VRFRDVLEPQRAAFYRVDVLRDIAIRVDDDRGPTLLAGNEVARLSQSVVIKAFEKHAGECLANRIHATQDYTECDCLFVLFS
jgi:hypothetical protein